MLRVLMAVTSLDCGGIENLLMNIYRIIDRSKIQFDFLTHRNTKFYFEDEVEKMGGKIYRMPPVNPIPGSRYRKELDRFFKEHKEYKIVHAHMNALSTYVLRAAKRNNVPVRIAHSHNSELGEGLIKNLIKRYSRHNLNRYCNYKFACSKNAGIFLFRKGFDNCIILKNGIDVEQYRYNGEIRQRTRERLNIKTNTVYGHVGSFTEQKNHDFLIDIFAEIKKRDDKSKLMLIGDGPLAGRIKEKINDLNLDNDVIMLGTRNDVNELLMAMDVFLFPSKYEGLGIALIEAQAAGLKCLASSEVPKEADVTGLVEFLSIEDNTKVWAENAIGQVSDRIDQSSKIKEAGYDIEYTANWLQKFYMNEVSKYDINHSS